MADAMQKLVDTFHTLLDEALIVAIASDYNLADSASYAQAHTTLEGLASDVPSEEATGFNASGITDATPTTSGTSGVQEPSSTDFSSSSGAEVPSLTSFDNNSDEDKESVLRGMFADLKEYDVRYALSKAGGDFQTALDDLLNVQYLASTGQQVKGIDGFFEPSGSKKKKKRGKGSGRGSPAEADDVQYLAERFSSRADLVLPIYVKNEHSRAKTAIELLDEYVLHGVATQDEAGKEAAEQLGRKYRAVPEKYMATIVHVAGSISQFADDIASLLNRHFSKPQVTKLDLHYRLTPLPKDDVEVSAAASSPGPAMDLEKAVGKANMHHVARRDAAASAAAMHRKGSSNPLYRQAASYYADRAREQARHAQEAGSTAADVLVAQQSTATGIDLHGVQVHDGVRIARYKVAEWWHGLGEMRAQGARETGGFTVVTGLGRHSAGGVSQLRQAVAAALLQDGWRVRVETGKFVVVGRRV